MAENVKKYLDTTALGTLVAQIKAEDAKVQAAAQKYTDDSLKLYEKAGAAATAEQNAKNYTDTLANGAVASNTAAITKLNGAATEEGSVAKAVADAKALIDADIDVVEGNVSKNASDIAAINHAETGILAQAKKHTDDEVAKVQGEVDALETYVGTIPSDYEETNVIAYVNKKAQETLDAASGGSSESAASVLAALNTYKAENDPKVTANATAASEAKTAADNAQAAADAAQDTVDALAEKVGTVPTDKTVVQMISDAQTAATYDDTQIKADIQSNTAAIATEKARMDAFMTLNEGETLNQALDSLKEIQDYITNEAADADILVGKVSALEDIVDGIGGEGESSTVVAYVTSAIEALKIGDYAKAADLVALTERMVTAEGKVTTLEGAVATKAEKTYVDEKVEALVAVDEDYETRIASLESAVGESGSVSEDIATAKQEAISTAAEDATTKANKALEDAKKYADDEDAKIEARVAQLETTSATHALASDLTTLAGKVTTAEGEIDTLQTEMDAVEALAAANKLAHEANSSAIALKADKTALDGAISRIGTLETGIETKAEQDDLTDAVERIAQNELDIAANKTAINSFAPITSDEVNALFA